MSDPNQENVPSKYVVERHLRGQGSLVEVFRARVRNSEDPVDLHLLRVPGEQDEALANRFIEIAGQMARVEHRAVLPVLDLGVTGGRVYFVTPAREARRLEEVLEEAGGTLSPERVLEIARDLSEGLAAIHAKGIVHRSISEKTVFVSEEGQAFFGECAAMRDLSVCRDPGAARTLHTSMASPEELLGMPDSERTDVFHLAALIYRCLSGRSPLALGKSAAPVSNATGILPLEDAADTSGWPEGLAEAVMHGLEWNPEKRPDSATVMAASFGLAGDGDPVAALLAADDEDEDEDADIAALVESSRDDIPLPARPKVRRSVIAAPTQVIPTRSSLEVHPRLLIGIMAALAAIMLIPVAILSLQEEEPPRPIRAASEGPESYVSNRPGEAVTLAQTEEGLEEAVVASEDLPTDSGNFGARSALLRDWIRFHGRKVKLSFSYGELLHLRFRAARGDATAHGELDAYLREWKAAASGL